MNSSPTVRALRAQRTTSASVPLGQRVAEAITRFSGSMTFVLIHVVWFSLWIGVNIFIPKFFDPFPFGLLTLIVSLEAIFLSTFVLISQNRQSDRADERAKRDFDTNLYSEALSGLIADRLGIAADEVQAKYRHLKEQAKREDEADPKT